MNAVEVRYRMGVAGSFAGLVAWALGAFIPLLLTLPAEIGWIAEVIDAGLVGTCIGGFGGGIAAWISPRGAKRSPARRAVLGAACGLAAGVAAVGCSLGVRVTWLAERPVAGIVLAWALVGAFIGITLGLIRHGRQWPNVLLAVAGGIAGAMAGALALVRWGDETEYVTREVGLMLTGLAICLCSELAVRVARRATLRFTGSVDPVVAALLDGSEWELLPRSRVLFGRGRHSSAGVLAITVPDRHTAQHHAWIRGRKHGFEIVSHDRNTGPDGGAVWTLEAGSPPKAVRGPLLLCDGDDIVVGRTRFTFTTRTRRAAAHPAATSRLAAASRVLMLIALQCFFMASASPVAAGQHLALAERPRLLRAAGSLEAPVFALQLNRLDDMGRPMRIPVLSPARARGEVRVTEAGSELRVCNVSLGALPERRAILLVDISGSMLEEVVGGLRKFDVMKEACRRFAATFENGVDHVAVIPFDSHDVASVVRQARFIAAASELDAVIEDLPAPSSGNTGLYTAVVEALGRLREDIEARSTDAMQCLLVVLTDGKNDVKPGDDPRLETELEPVLRAVAETGIQVITVGFGNRNNLDEDGLRRLAWPSAINYSPAERPEDVVTAFERARKLQVERLTVTFRPRQKLISQLVSPHEFSVSFAGDHADFTWKPRPVNVGEGVAEGCGGSGAFDGWRFSLLLLGGVVLHGCLWWSVPRRLWAAGHDARVLRARAERLWRR